MADAFAPDLRARSDDEILRGVAARDALALAEACARTLAAAVAVTRRILPAADLEPTLCAAYRPLWADPPGPETALEGWVRARCFALAVERLAERGEGPVAPSTRAAAPQTPAVEPAYLDATERRLAALDEPARRAVVCAHDAGVRSGAQVDPDAGQALLRGLLALADVEQPRQGVVDPRVADLALGLLPPHEAAAVRAALGRGDDAPGGQVVAALRRARRRLEGLPPTADVGLRLLARLLSEPASSPPAATAGPAAPAREPDRRPEPQPAPAAIVGERAAPANHEERPGAAGAGATDDAAVPPPARGQRVARVIGGLFLVAVGVAVGLFLVGPLLLDWLLG